MYGIVKKRFSLPRVASKQCLISLVALLSGCATAPTPEEIARRQAEEARAQQARIEQQQAFKARQEAEAQQARAERKKQQITISTPYQSGVIPDKAVIDKWYAEFFEPQIKLLKPGMTVSEVLTALKPQDNPATEIGSDVMRNIESFTVYGGGVYTSSINGKHIHRLVFANGVLVSASLGQ